MASLKQVPLCCDQHWLCRFWLSFCKYRKPRLSAVEHRPQWCLQRGMAASVELRPACFHPRRCLLACIIHGQCVFRVRFAALDTHAHTGKCLCRYRFSIPSITTEAILLLPIRMFLTAVPLIQRRYSRRSRLRLSVVMMNCALPTCKALVMR